jgi:ketosteroid isomerase-like protein
MTIGKSFALLLAGILILPGAATAQRQADVDAVNRLIDLYGATEDAMDMTAQARLMAADRVLISQAGRRTDQATNLRIQQASNDAFKKQVPGVQIFTEDRDRLAKESEAGPPEVLTLVLVKRDGEWKIVHTHISNL